MVEVIVVKNGRSRRFDPVVHGKAFLAKANVKPPAPIAENKQPDVRVEGKQLLHVSQTVPLRQPETVTTADFGVMFEDITKDLPKRPQRIIYQTRLSATGNRCSHGKRHK